MATVMLGVVLFTLMIIGLVYGILFARSKLVAQGDVHLLVNGEKDLVVKPGAKLLGALADKGLFVSSACGGGGTCGQCKVKVLEGGGSLLPTEESHINRRQAACGERLACQVSVKQDMKIEVPEEGFTYMPGEKVRMITLGEKSGEKLPEREEAPLPQDHNRGRHVIYTGGKYDSCLIIPVTPENS